MTAKRTITLDDIEAALWYWFRPAHAADVDAFRALVGACALALGAALAAEWDAVRRRAEMASAAGLAVHYGTDRASLLRAAHAEASRLRASGLPVPDRLLDLDRAYYRDRKRAQRQQARAGSEGEAA